MRVAPGQHFATYTQAEIDVKNQHRKNLQAYEDGRNEEAPANHGEPYPGAPMKVYTFTLVNKSGVARTTTLRGYSVFSAARMLKGTGYRPVAISPCINPVPLAILEGREREAER